MSRFNREVVAKLKEMGLVDVVLHDRRKHIQLRAREPQTNKTVKLTLGKSPRVGTKHMVTTMSNVHRQLR